MVRFERCLLSGFVVSLVCDVCDFFSGEIEVLLGDDENMRDFFFCGRIEMVLFDVLYGFI